jgi:hypothetical protein
MIHAMGGESLLCGIGTDTSVNRMVFCSGRHLTVWKIDHLNSISGWWYAKRLNNSPLAQHSLAGRQSPGIGPCPKTGFEYQYFGEGS